MSAYKRLKKRVYEIVGPVGHGDKASMVFDILLCVLVIASCAAVFVDLFVPVGEAVHQGLKVFEYVTVGIFILEYLVRLWVSDLEYPEAQGRLAAMWEYVSSFDSLIDIISILSVLINAIPAEAALLRMVKLLKLIKLVRLVKVGDYVQTKGKFHAFLERLQKRTNEVIDKGEEGDVLSKIYDITTIVLILLSVSFILVETFPIGETAHAVLLVFEVAIAIFFALEYVLRVWTAPLDYPALRPDKARMKYIFSFMSLIDLLSILPIFVTALPTATGILKIFKLCKILRLLKASRYLSGIANFGKAIQKKKKQILMSIIAIAVMITICSVLMYAVEHEAQPDVFENGFSGIVYSIQMMVDADTEIEPVTAAGQGLSVLMLLLGGCMFGVPVAIIATGFEDMIAEQAGEEPDADLYEVLREYDKLDQDKKRRFKRMVEADEQEDTSEV